jgi:hypothetical protein
MRIALALLIGVAAPAHAADLATIDCVGTKLDAAARDQIEADAARNLAESGKRPSYDPSVAKALGEAATACAAEHKWSEAASRAAGIYALAKIGLPVAQRVLGERGFEAADLEDQFQALPEDARNAPLTAADARKLVIAAVPDEERQTRENAELLNEFFAYLSTVQYASFDFSQA